MRSHVLEYHDVLAGTDPDASGFPGASAATYKLSVARFTEHLSAIAATGAPVRRADEFVDDADVAPVLFTFDDGGVGALDAADCLEQQGWRGHFLVATSQIGAPGFLTAAHIADLSKRGHLIGSHSHTHPDNIAALSEVAVRGEWDTSRERLQAIVSAPVWLASVPRGALSPLVLAAARDAGYRVVLTSEPTSRVRRAGNALIAGRFTLRSQSSAREAAAFAAGEWGTVWPQWMAWNTRKMLKKLGGRAYLSLRERYFERGA
jgi:peptidoglycan/xylan/chitin deacetylase (PgdA/CDA1 family)